MRAKHYTHLFAADSSEERAGTLEQGENRGRGWEKERKVLRRDFYTELKDAVKSKGIHRVRAQRRLISAQA